MDNLRFKGHWDCPRGSKKRDIDVLEVTLQRMGACGGHTVVYEEC